MASNCTLLDACPCECGQKGVDTQITMRCMEDQPPSCLYNLPLVLKPLDHGLATASTTAPTTASTTTSTDNRCDTVTFTMRHLRQPNPRCRRHRRHDDGKETQKQVNHHSLPHFSTELVKHHLFEEEKGYPTMCCPAHRCRVRLVIHQVCCLLLMLPPFDTRLLLTSV
jgi:hypothetical protein